MNFVRNEKGKKKTQEKPTKMSHCLHDTDTEKKGRKQQELYNKMWPIFFL